MPAEKISESQIATATAAIQCNRTHKKKKNKQKNEKPFSELNQIERWMEKKNKKKKTRLYTIDFCYANFIDY